MKIKRKQDKRGMLTMIINQCPHCKHIYAKLHFKTFENYRIMQCTSCSNDMKYCYF